MAMWYMICWLRLVDFAPGFSGWVVLFFARIAGIVFDENIFNV